MRYGVGRLRLPLGSGLLLKTSKVRSTVLIPQSIRRMRAESRECLQRSYECVDVIGRVVQCESGAHGTFVSEMA